MAFFLSAIGLFFVLEGILPFLSPSGWRRMMQQLSLQGDQAIRIMGLTCMLMGLAVVLFVRHYY